MYLGLYSTTNTSGNGKI